jgi:hypothetical protein
MGVLTATLLIGTGASAQDASNSSVANQSQVVQPPDGGVNWKGVGLGAGAVIGNLVYVPAKLAYGILGGLGGAAGYALTGGNTQVANSIWRSSLGGDYVLTPDMISGKKPIYFSGPSTPIQTPGGQSNEGQASNGRPTGTASTTSRLTNSTDSLSATSAPGVENSGAVRPMDQGAGFVGKSGTGNSPQSSARDTGYNYNSANRVSPTKKSWLNDTSIE